MRQPGGRAAQAGERFMFAKHFDVKVGLSLIAGLFALGGAAALAQEAPTDVLAAAVRARGHECTAPQGAERQGQAAPDKPVWLLRCANATYRVTLSPNRTAEVEKLR